MKAIQVHEFGGPEQLVLGEVPDPQPGPGQVVVRVHAAGVNPVETYIRSGIYGPRAFPYTPGSDAGGVVEAVGEGVTGVSVGDRVYVAGSLSGTYAEKTLCDAATQVHPLPDNVSFAQGAGVFVPYATAHRALFGRGRAAPGETVLVHGASGGVGIAAVQLAHRRGGLIVIGTAGTEAGRQLVAKQGADHLLDHHKEGYLDEAMALTGGKGVDLILEMLANVNLGKDLPLLAKFGRVVVIGSRGTVEINPRDTMARDAEILGMTLANVAPDALRAIHADLVAGLGDGTLRPVVGREIPLAEAPRAHEEVIGSPAHGKIVLVP